MSELVDTFTIIASVATAASAFVAAKTLFSIKKQRESTYKPELILEESDFTICSSNDPNRRQQAEYTYERKPIGYKSDLGSCNLFGIRLFNIGLGAAKQIDVKIDFNTIGAISQLSKNPSQNDNISGFIRGKRLEISYENILQCSLPINSEYLNKLNYILPVSTSDKPTFIYIPHYILELYPIFIYNYWKHSKINDPNNFPLIDISINYSDIGGKKMCKLFKVKFDFQGGTADTSWHRLIVTEENCA